MDFNCIPESNRSYFEKKSIKEDQEIRQKIQDQERYKQNVKK